MDVYIVPTEQDSANVLRSQQIIQRKDEPPKKNLWGRMLDLYILVFRRAVSLLMGKGTVIHSGGGIVEAECMTTTTDWARSYYIKITPDSHKPECCGIWTGENVPRLNNVSVACTSGWCTIVNSHKNAPSHKKMLFPPISERSRGRNQNWHTNNLQTTIVWFSWPQWRCVRSWVRNYGELYRLFKADPWVEGM